MARSRKSKTAWKADFSGIEARTKVPDDDYRLRVSEIETTPGEKGDEGYWRWKFKIVDDNEKYDGKIVTCITSFKPQALFNLRNLLEALGADIPDSETELDPDDYIDMECIGTVEMDGGYANVVDYAPLDEADEKVSVKGGDDDEDDRKSSKKAGKGKKAEKEDDDDEAPTEESVNEADEDELQELVDRFKLKKIDLDDYPKLSKKRAAVLAALEKGGHLAGGDDDDKGGDDEKVSADTVRDMDEDDLEELVKEHELDVDLDDFKTLKKKVNAVIDALEKADKLDE